MLAWQWEIDFMACPNMRTSGALAPWESEFWGGLWEHGVRSNPFKSLSVLLKLYSCK